MITRTSPTAASKASMYRSGILSAIPNKTLMDAGNTQVMQINLTHHMSTRRNAGPACSPPAAAHKASAVGHSDSNIFSQPRAQAEPRRQQIHRQEISELRENLEEGDRIGLPPM